MNDNEKTDNLTHESATGFFADVAPNNDEQKTVSPIPVLPELSIAIGLLVCVFSISYIAIPTGKDIVVAEDVRVTNQIKTPQQSTASVQDVFDDVRLKAKSAVVWDVAGQRMLFNKNGDEVLPLASVTKLMTALVAYNLMDPDDVITISQDALKVEGDSGFVDGEVFTMQDLADITLITSSNDGATALGASVASAMNTTYDAESVFVEAMNIKAQELGLSSTHFKNSTGLDVSPSQAGAYGSARDMALLMEHIILTVPDAVALTSLELTQINNKEGEYHLAENTNEVVSEIDGLIASKTGYTVLAGGNLVVAFNAGLNRPIIISVLGSTYYDRFNDTLELVRRTQEYLADTI